MSLGAGSLVTYDHNGKINKAINEPVDGVNEYVLLSMPGNTWQ